MRSSTICLKCWNVLCLHIHMHCENVANCFYSRLEKQTKQKQQRRRQIIINATPSKKWNGIKSIEIARYRPHSSKSNTKIKVCVCLCDCIYGSSDVLHIYSVWNIYSTFCLQFAFLFICFTCSILFCLDNNNSLREKKSTKKQAQNVNDEIQFQRVYWVLLLFFLFFFRCH